MTELLVTINGWIAGSLGPAALGCLLWGVVSVMLSPCHVASIPLIVGYVAGQEGGMRPRNAALYAAAFTLGLFITISLVGVLTSLLGRMLGDVGPWWTMALGGLLIWVALGMMRGQACVSTGGLMARLRVRGLVGAFVIGLGYGVVSGSCSFGFMAPILAVITVEGKISTGILLILLFGIGHCLPIAVAGSSTALVRRVLENGRFQQGRLWLRRAACLAMAGLGVYFIVKPLAHVLL